MKYIGISLLIATFTAFAAVETITTTVVCDEPQHGLGIVQAGNGTLTYQCYKDIPPEPVCPPPAYAVKTRDWNWDVTFISETNLALVRGQSLSIKVTPEPNLPFNLANFDSVESTGTTVDRLVMLQDCPGDFNPATSHCTADGDARTAAIYFAMDASVPTYCPPIPSGQTYYINVINGNLDNGNVVETCPQGFICTFHYSMGHN